ncbi:MAG: GumC family protein [Hyphomicrobiaceae bacterium]
MDAGTEKANAGREAGGDAPAAATLRSIAWRHCRLLIALALLGGGAAGAYARLTADRYEAYSIVQIADEGDAGRQIGLIRSRATARRVLTELKLFDDLELSETSWPTRIGWSGLAQIVMPPAGQHSDTAVEAFRDRLQARRIRNSPLVEIGFASASRVKAARIANAVSADYVNSQAAKHSGAAQAGLLEDKLKLLRTEASEAGAQVDRFKREHGMLDADGRPIDASALRRETERTEKARREARDARETYERARRMMLNSDVSSDGSPAADYPAIQRLREIYFDALRREADLSTRYGRRHPEMEKAEAEIAAAQQKLSDATGRLIRKLEMERDTADGTLREQERRLQQVRDRIAATFGKQAEADELERKASAARIAYQSALERTKQAGEALTLRAGMPRIVATAEVPHSPTGPDRLLITIAGLGFGLVIGVVLACLLEMRPRRPMPDEDAVCGLGVSVLASTPEIQGSRSPVGELAAIRQMIAAPQGAFARSIAQLGQALEAGQSNGGCRVLLFAPAAEGCGTSLIAANVALHFALTGRRTLLIDCDRQHASISAGLGATDGWGLVDHVAGPASAESAILKDRMTGLHLMPAGRQRTRAGNCRKALSRGRFSRALAGLRAHYDVIVLDSSPLQSAVDKRSVTDAADRIVVVADGRKQSFTAARKLIRELGGSPGKIAGMVLNRPASARSGVEATATVHELHADATVQRARYTAAA